MTRNFGPCGKCGEPMEVFSHFVPPVTWLGKPVCQTCADGLDRRPPLQRIVEKVYGTHFASQLVKE